jgi:hypothetical protein
LSSTFASSAASWGWAARVGKLCLILPMVLAVVGCGGAYDSTASGVVTLDGKPVPRGTVSFHPVAGGPAAYAMIGDDGSYTVQTGRAGGLPAGDYQVSITANENAAVAQTAGGGPPPPGKPITPLWYRMKETSGLQVTVKPGSNTIDLELKSQPPAGWKPGRTS